MHDEWKPGQHVSIFAPTGSGKTVLASQGLLPLRSHTLTIDAKAGADNLQWARRIGAEVGPRRPDPHPQRFWGKEAYPRRHYWVAPPLQDSVFNLDEALSFAWASSERGRAWTVFIDEAKMLSDPLHKKGCGCKGGHGLGLGHHIERLLRYGRGRGISLIAGTQSPRYVSSDLYDQPSWFFIGWTSDKRTVERYSEISGFDADVAKAVIPRLGEHQFWLIGPRRQSWITEFPLRRAPRRARMRAN